MAMVQAPDGSRPKADAEINPEARAEVKAPRSFRASR